MRSDECIHLQNISSSSSEISNLTGKKEPNLSFGWLRWRPKWLQRLNTIESFVFWLCLANCIQTMLTGLIGVVVSTLEKRYDLSSSQSSLIASASELGSIPIIIVTSYFENR